MIVFDKKTINESGLKPFTNFMDAVKSGKFADILRGKDDVLNEEYGSWWDILNPADKRLIRQGEVPGISNRQDYERYCDWLLQNEMFPTGSGRKADQDDDSTPDTTRYFRNGTRDYGQDLTKDSVHSVAAAIVKNWGSIDDAAKIGLGELIAEFERVLKAEGVDKQPAAQKYVQLAKRQLNKNMVYSLIAGIVHLGSNRFNARLHAYDKDPTFANRGKKYVSDNATENQMNEQRQIEYWAHMLDEATGI